MNPWAWVIPLAVAVGLAAAAAVLGTRAMNQLMSYFSKPSKARKPKPKA